MQREDAEMARNPKFPEIDDDTQVHCERCFLRMNMGRQPYPQCELCSGYGWRERSPAEIAANRDPFARFDR